MKETATREGGSTARLRLLLGGLATKHGVDLCCWPAVLLLLGLFGCHLDLLVRNLAFLPSWREVLCQQVGKILRDLQSGGEVMLQKTRKMRERG